MVAPDGNNIKIDQIRDLQHIFSYRSKAGHPKVYIIEQAEKMTVQAANSLLKFLEEPQVPAVGILITDNGQAMLPTIRSRAQMVPFSALNPEDMLQSLIKEGFPANLVRPAVHLASGLEACREILQQNWFAEIRNVMLQLGKESLGRGSTSLISAQQKLFKTGLSEHLDMLLSLFHLWFRDMLYVQYGRHEHIVFIDQLDMLSQLAHTRSTEQWVSYMDLAAACRKNCVLMSMASFVWSNF